MLEEYEVVNLIMAIAALMIFALVFRKSDKPPTPVFGMGLLLIVLGCFFTVAEGIIWGDALNLLEHICYASASILIALGIRGISRAEAPGERH